MSDKGQIDPVQLFLLIAVIVVGLFILAIVSGAVCPMIESGTPAPPERMC
jgi:uncharacterized membrane protein